MQRGATVVFVAVMLLVAPIAGVAASSGASSQASSMTAATSNSNSADDVFETPTDNLSVWERTPFSLRTTTPGATEVDNKEILIDPVDSPIADLQYDTLSVYDSDQTVELEFRHLDVESPIEDKFAGENANVIVGHFDPDGDAEEALADTPRSMEQFQELLAEDRLDEVNDNFTFSKIGTDEDATGFEDAFKPDDVEGPGQYIALVAVTDEAPGLTVTNGDLDPQGNAIIAGVEGVLAQDTASEVTVGDEYEPGDDIDFTADAQIGDDGEVHHAIGLYHEETFSESMTVLNLTAELDADFTEDDLIIESDLKEVNGVSNFDEDAAVIGPELANASQSGTVAITDVIAFLEGEFDTDGPEFVPGDETLDASAVAIADADVTEDITLETFDNWTEGEYQWVHVAVTDDGEKISTSGDTVEIEEEDPPDDDPPDDDPPQPPPEPVGEFELVDTNLTKTNVSVGEKFEAHATFRNVGDATETETIELIRNDEVVDSQELTIEPGEKQTIAFPQSIDEAGAYEYTIDGVKVGTVHVHDRPTEATFETRNASVSDLKIAPGDTIDITADVENIGKQSGTHTAELLVDGTVIDETNVTLDGGESEKIAFSHTFEELGEYNVSVNDALAGTVTVGDPTTPPELPTPVGTFDLSEIEFTKTQVALSEEFEVRTTFRNVGDATETETIELIRNGEVVDSQELTIDPGEKQTITVAQTIDEPGTYEYEINGVPIGSVEVQDRPGEATFEISDAELSEHEIAPGEEIDITATVDNVGAQSGTHTAELLVDGSVVDEVEVTVDGGESETITFSHVFEEPGEYEVSVDEVSAGTVTVVESEDTGVSPIWIVSFVIVVALLSVGAALVATGRITLP